MIVYRKGDATNPDIPEHMNCAIMHVCNNRGGWGKGFVLALSKRWPQPEAAYREWYRNGYWFDGMDNVAFKLGEVQCVAINDRLTVMNMIAQEGYGTNNLDQHQGEAKNTRTPLNYWALERCLAWTFFLARTQDAIVVAPKIGSGLGGGDWTKIEALINQLSGPTAVHIYEL